MFSPTAHSVNTIKMIMSAAKYKLSKIQTHTAKKASNDLKGHKWLDPIPVFHTASFRDNSSVNPTKFSELQSL